MKKNKEPFWKTKTLDAMSTEEWELLCDRCGRCCLEKFEDEETGEIFYTNVTCSCLDPWECSCLAYEERTKFEPDCLELTYSSIFEINWLPSTCAYRLIMEGRDLEWWHPLVSGDPATVHKAGISIRNKVVPGKYVKQDELEAYIVETEGKGKL